ncbi:centromere protein F isoform X2 [Heterodontus francisci]|uniref:centromere protein F isoform X2 n=1 Tax=Heterodontus francisci TaxID=7792 RepID=UPI00355C661C
MSWAVEEWKEGLPTKALQKIQEIETQLDKLKKERQQRQFQLESLEAALLKQKQKVENEKTETSALKREHQNLIESCENLEKTRQKISHELQVKESQVHYLEGQLASSKKRVDKLEQENKRNKSELERNQQTIMPADVQSRTPQRNLSGSMTPNKNVADSKVEELQEKYNKEVEERSRLETELKIIQLKLINQTQPQSTTCHWNIARQRSSSVFPWQQDQTPSQQTSHSLETPLKKGVAVNLQWEQEETPFRRCPKSLQKTTQSTGWFNNSTDSFKQEEQLKLQNQELQTNVLDLEFRLQAQEKEIKNHMNKLHEIQFQFEKAKTDLSEKECKLSKCRDELAKVTAQCEQASTKCMMVEQKLKQVSDELSCHRQNADSTRRNMEQKLKDKEKDFQQELSHQQHSLQSLDQQFNQMKNKLNQELQQAKNDYNVLQLEIDKVSAHKQKLERELDETRQQLCCSNQMLKENQTKENDLKKKLEDIHEERNCHSNQLHKNSTQIHQLEDELKKTKEDFNRTWNFGEKMKSKNTAQEAEMKSLQQKLDEQSKSMCINMENLKQQISQLKMEHDSALKDVKEKARNIEKLNIQVGTMENEIEELQKNMQLKEKAFQEVKKESNSLAQWKVENMQVVNNFQCEREVLENKIKELEQSLEVSLNKNQEQEQNLEVYQCKCEKQSEKVKSLEDEKENLQRQTDNLKRMLDNKISELETQKQTFEEFMIKARQKEQKYEKEVENLSMSIFQQTSQIAELEKNLQQETNKVEELEESQHVFNADYENVSNLAKSKDCLIQLKETEILNLKDNILQTTHNLEEQLSKVEAEKNHLMEEYEKSLLDKLEVENAKSTLDNYRHDISVFKEQITSQESSLKLEKQLRSEIQSKYETLLKLREELEEKIEETEKKCKNLQAKLEQEIHQLKMQHAEALQATIDEKDKSIQNFAGELETNVNNLKSLQITNKELEAKLEVCLQSEKCIQEKEELISLKKKELKQLSEENEELKDSINTLRQENMELNKMNSCFADVVKKNEAMLQEQTKKCEEATTRENILKDLTTVCEELTEKQKLLENIVAAKENDIKQLLQKMNEKEIRTEGLMHQYAVLEEELKNLREKCNTLEENKDFLEMQLHERAKELLVRNAEVEELKKKYAESSAEYNAKIVDNEERVKAMIEEKEGLQLRLEKMEEIDHLKKELSESSARQNKILQDYNELFQEKEQLTHLITKQAEKETIFATKIEKLENDLIILQSENIKNSKLIAEKSLTSDQLKDTVITKEIELQKLQAQLQLLQMDLEDKEASLESCISQLEQMQTDNNNVVSKFQHSEETRTLLENELSAMQSEMKGMQLKFIESKNHEESLLGQIAVQRQMIEELKSEFEKQKEDLSHLHSLENQLNESQKAEKQCQLKEKEIKELQEKLVQSEIQISDLKSQNSDIESQMDSRQQELKAQMQITLSNMENALQQSEEQRALVQKDLSQVQSELAVMHLHFIESKNCEESFMEQIALQRKTIENLTSELEKSKEQEAHLLHSLENMKNQLNSSQTNNKLKAEAEYRQNNKEILELGEIFSRAQLQLNDLIIQCPLDASQQKLKNECGNSLQHENKETTAERYTVFLQAFSSCQLARENLVASLQQADKKYEDLKKAYKSMQHEKTLLAPELDNLIPCIGICGKNSCLAEKKQVLTNEMRHSGVENVFLQTELEMLNAKNENSNKCPSQNENDESMIIPDELQQCKPSYDDLKHSNEQLKKQLMKIKQKLFSYQHQNGKLHDQNCNTMLKVSELQSIIASLETEKVSLLSKVDLTPKNIDLETQEYKIVKEEMIVCQETRDQNIPEEKEMADYVIENDSSGEKKNRLRTIEKNNDAVKELKAELSLLQNNLIEIQAALSGTKIENVTLQSQLRVLDSSLKSVHLLVSEQKECSQLLEKMIQEKDDEVILLHQQLKENSADLTVNDQAIFSVKGAHLKVKTVELETRSVTSEQSITLLKEQLQKQQNTANEETWELHQTLTVTRQELESLKQQHSSEIEEWQLKLTNLTTEMENKLAAQKQQTELLSAELEGARIQLQFLDLSSQSLLYASYHYKESTPQKLKHIDSKKQQREMTTVIDQLEFVNSLNVSPDSKVQREQKASLQYGTIGETPVFSNGYTIHFDNAENISKDVDDVLNESNTKQRCVVEQIHLGNEKVSVPVECQSTHDAPIGSQIHLEQEPGQILHLLPDEENKKITEVLLSEMEDLRSRLDTQQKELFLKSAAYTELEKKMLLFEEEKHHLCNELKSSAVENQNLSDKAKNLEEELINKTLQLKLNKVKLSDVTNMLESREMDKNDRNEQFLELENELKLAKSDKANLEKHILEMEVDLDELQIRKQSLEKELESRQRTISVQTEKLTELEAENNGVIQELSTLAETNDELEQASKRLKANVQELEAEKAYNTNTIQVLEAEVKKLTSQLQTIAEQMEKVSKEEEDMNQKLQYLEKNATLDTEGREKLQQQLNQLKKENLSLLEQTETMQSKLNVVELEKLKLLQSLESSLLEKGEDAARLTSTKAEVAEMRHAIEKLKVRIEADQNKRQHMAEKLKVSERKADSLQDKIEALERELQTSEENMEHMVLQAETAKEQVEILKEEKETITEKLELLTVDLNSFISEKQALEKQLQQSQEKLKIHCSNLSRNSEAAELEKLKMTEAYESSVKELQSQISQLNEKVKICNEELEKLRENEKSCLSQNSHLECEKIQLSNQLHEADGLNVELQSANAILSKNLQVVQQQLNKHIEDKVKLEQQIADLEQLKHKDSMDLCNLHIEVDRLNRERVNLQTAAAESQQAAQDLSAKHRVIQDNEENSEKQLQNELQVAQLQASALITQINDLTENNRILEDDLSITNEKILKMQQEFDAEKNLSSAQLEEFRNQTESLKLQLEISQSEKSNLEKDVGYLRNELQITDVLKKEVDEHKQRLRCIQEEHQAVLKDLQVQHEVQVESYQEKMAGMEQQLTAQNMEINNLKAAKEEVNVALNDAMCKVNDLTENNSKLQDDLSIANEKILKMQQEFDAEKNLSSAQLEEFRNQAESLKLQLEISQSEKYNLEKDVGYLRNELQITDVLKKEVDEHKQRLRCIQEEHQAVLKDLQEQHEVQVESYQEKMAGMEQQLTAQNVEINNLKAAKEEVNVALNDAICKHEVQVESYQEKMVGMEQQLTSQGMEINNLKTAKEEVNVALKDAICKADELQKSVAKLKGDKECAQNKLLLWMKSCKQLEHEKESLKKHIRQQEELLTKLQKSPNLGPNSQIDELTTEMEELKEELEEKTKEADENMEKYWNLIKSSHKLEEENEMLKSRVVLLSNKLEQPNSQDKNSTADQVVASRSAVHKKCEKKSPGQFSSQQKHQRSPDVSSIAGLKLDAPMELAVNKSHKKCRDSQSNLTTKRVRGTESKEEQDELKSEALQNSSKRTKSDKEHAILLISAAQDKTVYEPEGLPHIVKKGLADIPSVSLSPYILRRTTLLNRASSGLAVQSRISPHRQTQHKGVAQTCNKSETTAESSHAQQHPTESTCSSPALLLDPIPALAEFPLSSLRKSPKKMGFDTPGGKQLQKSRCPLNTKKSVGQKKQQKEQITVTEENENCKVQ